MWAWKGKASDLLAQIRPCITCIFKDHHDRSELSSFRQSINKSAECKFFSHPNRCSKTDERVREKANKQVKIIEIIKNVNARGSVWGISVSLTTNIELQSGESRWFRCVFHHSLFPLQYLSSTLSSTHYFNLVQAKLRFASQFVMADRSKYLNTQEHQLPLLWRRWQAEAWIKKSKMLYRGMCEETMTP